MIQSDLSRPYYHFTPDGLIVIADWIFPSADSTKLELFVQGDRALLNSMDLFQLSPAQSTTKEDL